MKHYIVSCRISSSSLPGGSVGDSSVSKIYSERELEGVKQNIPYLISQKKVFEFKDKDSAILGLGKINSVDVEFVKTVIEEEAKAEIAEAEKIIEEAIIEEEAKAEIAEAVSIENNENINYNKKNKKNR